jgi:4-hydroxy-tetrahydrodipicolinate synthase
MFQGSMVALVTPMRMDDSIDEDVLRRLIDYHIDNKTDAIIAVGTTGESATLNMDEHWRTIQVIVEQSAGRVPVIAGTGANSTREAILLTQCAYEAKADACLSVTPYYNKPTQEGLYLHYKIIAESTSMPQILYNVPGRTGCDLLPETVERLAKIKNIVGIKEAVGNTARMQALIQITDNNFYIYSGDDESAMELMLMGGKGVISVTANVAPQSMHELCEKAIAGDRAGAEEINNKLIGLHQKLFVESNPIPVKWALHTLGLIPGGIRLPLTRLSEKYHAVVKEAMKQAGVL